MSAVVRFEEDGPVAVAHVVVTEGRRWSRAAAAVLTMDLARQAVEAGRRRFRVVASDALLRGELRARGAQGAHDEALEVAVPFPTPDGRPIDAAAVAELLPSLVPGVRVERVGGSTVRRLLRQVVSGVGVADFVVHEVDAVAAPFALVVPNRDDLLPDQVAAVVATILAIRRRFPAQLSHLKRVAFDRSDRMLTTGHAAALANLNTSTVHAQAPYVTSAGVDEEMARVGRLIPMTLLMAHELWHLVELTWQTTDYEATIAFRREVGALFGVDTLEQVFRDNAAAKARLAGEVSTYATTNPVEATAEMFERWWCLGPVSPVIAGFGALVDAYLPPPSR